MQGLGFDFSSHFCQIFIVVNLPYNNYVSDLIKECLIDSKSIRGRFLEQGSERIFFTIFMFVCQKLIISASIIVLPLAPRYLLSVLIS